MLEVCGLHISFRSTVQLSCGDSAAVFVSCPRHEQNSKPLGTGLHTDLIFIFFLLIPHGTACLSSGNWLSFVSKIEMKYTEQSESNFRALGPVQSPELPGRVLNNKIGYREKHICGNRFLQEHIDSGSEQLSADAAVLARVFRFHSDITKLALCLSNCSV